MGKIAVNPSVRIQKSRKSFAAPQRHKRCMQRGGIRVSMRKLRPVGRIMMQANFIRAASSGAMAHKRKKQPRIPAGPQTPRKKGEERKKKPPRPNAVFFGNHENIYIAFMACRSPPHGTRKGYCA